MALEPLETAEAGGYPGCQQISVFLENRVGQLLRLTRLFDGLEVRILGLSVDNSVDCAVVRMVVDDPDTAYQMLRDVGFATSQTEVLVVELPPGKSAILTISRALIRGEVNIDYLYPLISSANRPACMAIHVDNLPAAEATLRKQKFRVLSQEEL